MKNFYFLKFILRFCVLELIFVSQMSGQEPGKPNIIVIFADDMGYSDIGSFGAEIHTPNLDSLANTGVRLSQFYSAGRCCPSRASLLTGLYPHMTGMGWMTGVDMQEPGYIGDLNKENVTIAEVLKPADYGTYAIGKWHVSENVKYDGPKHNWPLQRGFDKFYGIIPGAANYFTPVGLTSGNEEIKSGKDFYLTEAISDTVVDYIEQHLKKERKSPFFMYVSYTAPHWPLHAREKDIEKYIETYSKGWDKLRQERYNRQQQLGVIDTSTKLTERDSTVPAWKIIPKNEKDLWVKRMAVYAAQVDAMDQGVGQIIGKLKRDGIFDKTMIIFIADNGGSAENISRTDKSIETLGTEESYESYRKGWANASNTPFRQYKSSLHEGGIISPFIISWPEGFAQKGTIINKPTHIMDLMPTFVAVSGAQYPGKINGQKIAPLPGNDLMKVIKNKESSDRPIFWEHEAHRAVRLGKWKLVSEGKAEPPYTKNWELYDMAGDRSETNDLAAKYPEKVRELEILWTKWAEESRVFPLNGTNIPTRFKTFGRKKTGYH